jgi:hypothetical protein
VTFTILILEEKGNTGETESGSWTLQLLVLGWIVENQNSDFVTQ